MYEYTRMARRVLPIDQDTTLEATPLVSDTLIFVDSSSGPVTLTLAPVLLELGHKVTVLHKVPANVLTIAPPALVTIQGLPNLELAGDGVIRSVDIVSDGAAYFIV